MLQSYAVGDLLLVLSLVTVVVIRTASCNFSVGLHDMFTLKRYFHMLLGSFGSAAALETDVHKLPLWAVSRPTEIAQIMMFVNFVFCNVFISVALSWNC